MEIEYEILQQIISDTTFKSTGALPEQKYCDYLIAEFPNHEVFWKTIIVPFTNRICLPLDDIQRFTDPREGVAEEMHEIGSFHYGIFLNIVYAHHILENKHYSFFENFYVHLGSICDLVEELLLRVYFLIIECQKIESNILNKLTKTEFLEIAADWYDENYSNLFEQYFQSGKPNPIRIPNRKYLLAEYFEKSKPWKAYASFSQLIRQYRNVHVHHYNVASLKNSDTGEIFVPKKEKIGKYKRWRDVTKASQDTSLHTDFISQDILMTQDISNLKKVLNSLWEKPIQDLSNLLFIERNEVILKKYNMTLV